MLFAVMPRLAALLRTLPARLLVGLLLCASAAVAQSPEDASLLRRLGDPSERVRDRALRRLRLSADLTGEDVLAALDSAAPGAVATLLELAGTRGFDVVAPRAAQTACGDDPLAAEAALRCLVVLGDAAVARGLACLPADGAALSARRLRLRALTIQDAVEQDLIARWRRKGGTYEGRFSGLRRHGFACQPVLLAMLLDVPLEDRFLALPEDGEPSLTRRFLSLREVLRSQRRGYRTFRPLPPAIHADDLFELSAQALMDVGDMEILGDVLERLAETLEAAHERYLRIFGFQLRPWEEMFADSLDEILAANGRKERLQRRVDELQFDVRMSRRRAMGRSDAERADALQWYMTDLSRLAGVLHRMGEFERAAAAYAEVITVSEELGGEPPAIASYNRACALARAGRTGEALDQLDASLASDLTDLTREWVEEDGDLRSLRGSPRFQKMLDRYFGAQDD